MLVLSSIGCHEGEQQAAFDQVRVGDTIFVHSHRPEYADTIGFREVMRIGMLDGPEEYAFGDIRSFVVGQDGDLFVYDWGTGIRHYSSDGRFVGRLARQGEGPREVRYPAAMAASLDAIVAVQDVQAARISIFHPGDSVTLIPGPSGKPAFSDGDALLFHTDGTLWVKLHPWWPPPGGITHPRAIYARVDMASKALMDTIFTPASAADECPTLTEHPWSQGVWQDVRAPWIPLTMWTWGPDGSFALGCPATYQFTVTKPTGESLKISRDWMPVPEVKEAIAYMERFTDLKDLPSTLPAYSQIVLPGDGRIWVWPTQPSRKVEAREHLVEMFGITEEWVRPIAGAFDVFGSDGHWIAVVKPPDGVEHSGFPTREEVLIRGDTMWAVAKDSLGVNYLVRAEIVWPESGS